jgi:hypothetical protein
LGIDLCDPLCVFDIAVAKGLEIWFINTPSIEAVYSKTPQPVITLSSGRPLVRQAYSCGHELGHHIFGHGTRVEKFAGGFDSNNPEEFLAECFAGYLLMPPTAICRAFSQRGWNVSSPLPHQILTVASQYGVGYTTLIYHLQSALKLLERRLADDLLRQSLPTIRKQLVGEPCRKNVVVVDQFWGKMPIDLTVGDLLLLPPDSVTEGDCVEKYRRIRGGLIFEATRKGIGRFENIILHLSAYIRVSDRDYVGRSDYRHLGEEDE